MACLMSVHGSRPVGGGGQLGCPSPPRHYAPSIRSAPPDPSCPDTGSSQRRRTQASRDVYTLINTANTAPVFAGWVSGAWGPGNPEGQEDWSFPRTFLVKCSSGSRTLASRAKLRNSRNTNTTETLVTSFLLHWFNPFVWSAAALHASELTPLTCSQRELLNFGVSKQARCCSTLPSPPPLPPPPLHSPRSRLPAAPSLICSVILKTGNTSER
ncbi:hypothetical protein E2C01_031907 [Portunus trituberculatus]|uniref:Uncharacterized protein n=1 Tax=Portunus trituberculatus TaxID=210409 RepID=A0A5B7EUN7_PORTR|nr:hypothetical protein [Portunus trituberculatus]